jgi:hypothetical protein
MPATFWYFSVGQVQCPRLARLAGLQQLPLPSGHLGDLDRDPWNWS